MASTDADGVARAEVPELIYARHERGFALISQRTEQLQRMYFQCDPTTDPATWSDERIWRSCRPGSGAAASRLREGPITEKMVLPFRSLVAEPMQHGNLFLASAAPHTVPPTGAKGLDLAPQAVRVLQKLLDLAITHGRPEALADYSRRALE